MVSLKVDENDIVYIRPLGRIKLRKTCSLVECTVLLTIVLIRLVATQCNMNNGGCSHLCLLSSTSFKNYTCRCPNGMLLLSDGESCARTPEMNSTTPQTPVENTTRNPERGSSTEGRATRKTITPTKTILNTTDHGMVYFDRDGGRIIVLLIRGLIVIDGHSQLAFISTFLMISSRD